jgi:poly(A) polymerase
MAPAKPSPTSLPDGAAERLHALLQRPHVAKVMALLTQNGESARIIGGAVRNAILGREVSDIDISTTLLPQNVIILAKSAGIRAVPTGLDHGTVTLVVDGQPIEVTTLREDVATDGRHAQVRFGRDHDADARRRDFTINALGLSLDGVLHDVVGGLADMSPPRMRFIGEPADRISEDYLRILRFFRFSAHFSGGMLDHDGLKACIKLREGLSTLSRERVRAEILKLLAAENPGSIARILSETGIWSAITGLVLSPVILDRIIQNSSDPVERLAAASVLKIEDSEQLGDVLRLSNAQSERLLSYAKAREFLAGDGVPSAHQLRHAVFLYGVGAVSTALVALDLMSGNMAVIFQAIAADPPVDPFTGGAVLEQGIPPGPLVGGVLKAAQIAWIAADFPKNAMVHADILSRAIRNLQG